MREKEKEEEQQEDFSNLIIEARQEKIFNFLLATYLYCLSLVTDPLRVT